MGRSLGVAAQVRGLDAVTWRVRRGTERGVWVLSIRVWTPRTCAPGVTAVTSPAVVGRYREKGKDPESESVSRSRRLAAEAAIRL